MRKIVQFGAMLLLALHLVASMSGIARAAIVLHVESKTVASSSSTVNSFFDVFFDVEPGVTGPTLAGYDITLQFTPTAGVTFALPIPEFTDRTPVLPPDHISFDTSGTNFGSGVLQATAFADPGFDQPIDDFDGLIRIPFSIAPNTMATIPFTISIPDTDLADSVGDPIEYSVINGTLSIVPEPATGVLVLVAIALLALGGMRRRANA